MNSADRGLLRRLNNVIARGKLLKTTWGKITRLKVGLMAKEVYDGIEYPQNFGMASYPPADSQALVHFLAGNRDHGYVDKVFNPDLVPDDLEEGETVIYNAFNARITLDKNSNIIVTTGENLTININADGTIVIDSPSVTFSGEVTVVGDLTVSTINGVPVPP